jgi:peptidoglycan/xylan/chitin deacetylase (PgdA/CDA1 family)
MAPFFRLASIAASLVSATMIAQNHASAIPAPILTPQSTTSELAKTNDAADAHLQYVDKREYGVITSCKVPGTVAMTFDDGPYKFTNQLLDQLKDAGVKATFFVNGHNIGDIYQYDWVVKRAYNEGHQIASHTWSHADLTRLSYNQIHRQMVQCKLLFGVSIGVSIGVGVSVGVTTFWICLLVVPP